MKEFEYLPEARVIQEHTFWSKPSIFDLGIQKLIVQLIWQQIQHRQKCGQNDNFYHHIRQPIWENLCMFVSFGQRLSTTIEKCCKNNVNFTKNLNLQENFNLRNRSREINSCQFWVRSNSLAKNGTIWGYKINHTIGEPGVPENLINEVVGHNGCVTGFPNDTISLEREVGWVNFRFLWFFFVKSIYHHSWSVGQISSNSSKVEGRYWCNESLEWPVPHEIQCSLGILRNRLVFCEFFSKIGIESEKVHQFCCWINFSLK